MWATEGRYTTDLPLETVWRVWTDVSGWPRWADDIVWARLDGPFASGAAGRIRYRGLPPMKFFVRSVEPMRSYVTEVPLPFGALTFDHRVETTSDGRLVLVERISFEGALAALLGRLQGPRIKRGWPDAMERLVALAKQAR